MGHADGGTCLVDMLSAGTAGAVVIHPHIIHVQVYFHIIVDFRHHIHSGEGGMPPFGSVKGGNTDKPVHPFFRFQEAVGILPLHHVFGALNACFITGEHIQLFQFKTFRFRPFHVHADQHFRPVLGFCAASTGVEGEDSIVFIIFAGQKEFDFLLVHDFFDLIQLFGNFRFHGLIVLFHGQIQDILQSLCPFKKLGVGFVGIFSLRCFLGNFAGFLCIIPESRITHLNVVTSDTFLQLR